MGGVGLAIMVVSLLARVLGLDLDDQQVTEVATASVAVLGFIYLCAGQLFREDLKWGIKRKQPLE